jgi:hypothetical protein
VVYLLCRVSKAFTFSEMAGRKRNPDPNLYSTKELALAVDITPRNVILLCEREDLPIVSGGGGPGQHRLLDITGFAKAVVIGAFADAGLPLSEGVKIADAISSYLSRQLPQALASYISQKELASTAFDNQPEDIFAIVYSGRHLIFQTKDNTIVSYPNYMSDQPDQMPRRYYVEPQLAGSIGFSDKKKFFEHLFKHARVRVKVNVSQALRLAALKMRMIKFG